MDEVVAEFLKESSEQLESLDDALMTLEQQPDEAEAVRQAFQVMHSIKGTSGFLGLNRLGSLAHAAEDLLGAFRDGKLTATSDRMQVIFDAVDRIRKIMGEVENNQGEEADSDDSDLKDRIRHILDGGDESGGASETKAADSDSSADAAGEAEGQPESGPTSGAADATSAGERNDGGVDAVAGDGGGDGEAAVPAEAEDSNNCQTSKADGQSSGASADGQTSGTGAGHDAQTKGTDAEASGGGSGQVRNGAGKSGGDAGGGQQGDSSIRVSTTVLDKLQNTVSELVLIRNQLLQIDREQTESPHTSALQRLDQIVSEAQEEVMQTRMQEIGVAWKRMRRLVRDLNKELGKRIELTTEGEEAELDRQILESLKQPLNHILRNAADHGIELPDERQAAGKDETGRIHMRACQEAGHVVIDIVDDGRGLDADKIAEKALEKGITTQDEISRLDEHAIRSFLFRPGFSTAREVTSVSGRGVGMDVVRADIERIGGTIELTSEPGRGTKFSLKIPLTLAIISALVVQSGTERFAIPQSGINEIVRVAKHDHDASGAQIEHMQGARLLRLRDRLLPLVPLHETLGIDATEESGERYVVVVHVGQQKFGVIVDKVYDTEEIVVKPTSQLLSEIPYYSGCTILGDGSIVMILDPNGISPPADETDKANQAEAAEVERRNARENRASDEQNFLVFRTGDPTPKACPLDVVERIEEIKPDSLEYGNGRALVQYRGDLMPLIPFDGSIDLENPDRGVLSVLVFAEENKRVGLVVSRVVDIVEAPMNINWQSKTPGVLGTTVINERTTDIVDVGEYIQEFAEWFQRTDPEDNKPVQETRPWRALYVDDSGLVRSLVMPILMQCGFDVESANDAVEAEQVLQNAQQPFDIIVSDIEMPRKDGIEFVKDLRNDGTYANVPKIALTSNQSEQDVQRCMMAGYDDHVSKFDRNKLYDAVMALTSNTDADTGEAA